MCTEGKCCCLKLETGTLIFGVIASVLNALSILAVIGGLIGFNVYTSAPQESYNYDVGGNRFSVGYSGRSRVPTGSIIAANVGMVFALLKSVMDFTFTVLLCNGVTKRRPSHIKAYFIYGIVMAVLYSIAVVILSFVAEVFMLLAIGTVGLVLYGLILHMIKLTHVKLSVGEVYGFEHKPLQETVY